MGASRVSSLRGGTPACPSLPQGLLGAIGKVMVYQLVYGWLEDSYMSAWSKAELPRARAHLALWNRVQLMLKRGHASQDALGWVPTPNSQENQTAWAAMSVVLVTCSNWHKSLLASASQHSPRERKVGPWWAHSKLLDARKPGRSHFTHLTGLRHPQTEANNVLIKSNANKKWELRY